MLEITFKFKAEKVIFPDGTDLDDDGFQWFHIWDDWSDGYFLFYVKPENVLEIKECNTSE